MRQFLSLLSGALFGVGLLLSGMTNTDKVQGFLDLFGSWDPTLAFVMGGALIPMVIAWQLTRGRQPLVGGAFPSAPSTRLDRQLIVGSLLFGAGWALAGLCPGPALASLSFGDWQGAVFAIAMAVGMMATPRLRFVLDRRTAKA